MMVNSSLTQLWKLLADNSTGSLQVIGCTESSESIRLNPEGAKKPIECLGYLIVHEMVYLQEPTHNARFVLLMDGYMTKWERQRRMLNRLPLRHEEWGY